MGVAYDVRKMQIAKDIKLKLAKADEENKSIEYEKLMAELELETGWNAPTLQRIINNLRKIGVLKIEEGFISLVVAENGK